jgi:hypothetical protein
MTATVSIFISVAALVFSFLVFFDSRRKDKRDLFLKMHQLMISDDIARGRYLLFEKVADGDSVEQLTDGEYRDINRALATYNAMGLYVKNKYVRERDVMDLWANPIYRAWHTAQPFIAHRTQFQGYRPWRYFDILALKAERELSRKDIKFEVKVWSRSGKPQGGPEANHRT